ncbi:hypothetical protein L6R53_04890 [Myxococcota bacterium]|nr:hypothetical protein [Myxococcota bacterium]
MQLSFVVGLLLSCASRAPAALQPGDSVAARAAGRVEVRYRPVFEVPAGDPAALVAAVPGGQWDLGLAAACEELLALHVDPEGRIDAPTASLVAARAGYPGQARFLRARNGGAFPDDLVQEVAAAAAWEGAVDLGLAVRRYADGTALWVVAWSRQVAWVDPLLRDVELDQPVPVRVELRDPALADAELRLFLAPPDGPVQELALTAGVTRWLDRFHTPGPWRVEAVATREGRTAVALLFSLFVGQPAPVPAPLAGAPATPPDPVAAEAALFVALNDLRGEHGLPPVQGFSLFEPLVREHAAFMAAAGRALHVLPGMTPGVAERARGYAFPFAFHHEAVATAPTWQEAMALVVDSPAHRKALLCEACTHATVGVALEPSLGRMPRLFVTWELMEFPKGPPRRIDTLDR